MLGNLEANEKRHGCLRNQQFAIKVSLVITFVKLKNSKKRKTESAFGAVLNKKHLTFHPALSYWVCVNACSQ
jgi:hypothetical protein